MYSEYSLSFLDFFSLSKSHCFCYYPRKKAAAATSNSSFFKIHSLSFSLHILHPLSYFRPLKNAFWAISLFSHHLCYNVIVFLRSIISFLFFCCCYFSQEQLKKNCFFSYLILLRVFLRFSFCIFFNFSNASSWLMKKFLLFCILVIIFLWYHYWMALLFLFYDSWFQPSTGNAPKFCLFTHCLPFLLPPRHSQQIIHSTPLTKHKTWSPFLFLFLPIAQKK